MQLDQTIKRFRARHEALFRAVIRVERSTDSAGTFDPDTGQMDYEAPETIYEGPGNIRETARWEGVERTTGEEEIIAERAQLRLPHDTPIMENDVVTVISAEHDASIVGARYRIIHVLLDNWQVVRRGVLERIADSNSEEES